MADQLDVTRGNERRKALLALLMQRAGGGNSVNTVGYFGKGALGGGAGRPGVGGRANAASAGSAQTGVPFGGMAAQARNRASQGTALAQRSQVAAAFLGGLGPGGAARPGADQGNGGPVSRYLPTGGGPVQRRVAGPEAPQSDFEQAAPQDAPSAPVATSTQEGLDLGYPIQPNGSVLAADVTSPEALPSDTTFGSGRTLDSPHGATPTSGASGLIPLGGGAYFDPATGTVRYPNNTQAL
jgi:hypothetical protein